MSTPGHVEVAPERLPGWVERFTTSHGEVSRSVDRGTSPSSCLLTAADGSWARLSGWADAVPGSGDWDRDGAEGGAGPGRAGRADVTLAHEMTQCHVPPPPALLLILVRRGGYAVAVAAPGGDLVSHKVGTRYVQSRTAAGGWSQQRYARRRANQADELIGAVVGHAGRVLSEGEASLGPAAGAGQVGGLVLGGDRALADQVLQELALGPLARLHDLPRRELMDVPNPRRSVLDDAVARGRAVQVEVWNAG